MRGNRERRPRDSRLSGTESGALADAAWEARSSALVRDMSNALVAVDLEGRVLAWNRAAERLFGWSAEEVLGRGLPSVPDAERDEWRADVERICAGETVGRDHERRRGDGSIVQVRVAGAPLHDDDGTVVGVVAVYEEIGERLRIQGELHESRERLRATLDALAEGIVVQRADGAIELCNAAAEQLLGLTADQMAGRTSTDPRWGAIHEDGSPFPGEDHPAMVTLRTGQPQRGVVMGVHHPDGTLTWISINSQALMDDGATPRAVVSSFFDITPLVAARDAEIVARAQLEAIVDASPAAVIVLTPEDEVVSWNRAAERMFGWTAAEVLGKRHPIVPEGEEEGFREKRARVAAGETIEGVDVRRQRKDGTLIDVTLYSAPIRDPEGRIALSIAVAVDLAEERRAREQELITRFFELSRDPMTIASLEGRFVRVNPAFEEALGYTAEEIYNEPLERFIHPDERAAVRRNIDAMRAGAWTPADVERQVVRKDGAVRRFVWRMNPPTDEGLVYGTCRDVEEERRREETILGLNADLNAQAAELTVANRELAAANAELDSFARSISHDLRAPLRSIAGFSQVLLDDYAGAIDSTGQGYLARVVVAAQRMAELIDDLLTLSRVAHGPLRRSTVDLAAVAREVVGDLQAADPGRAVDVAIPDRLEASGDPVLLHAVVQNLLENAWKFTSAHERARIELGTTEDDGERAYFVRDDGAGFDDEYADKLFQPFQRLHSAGEFPGTGIGLAIVRRIVERHGGRCRAEGRPEEGATIRFTLGEAGYS